MKFCPINPIPDLPSLQMPKNDMHLLLTHLGDDFRYSEFYSRRRQEGDYLIVDNGAYEFGKSLPLEAVIEYAYHIKAQEVVVPDIMRDSVGTYELFRQSLNKVPGDMRVMVVPQGEDRTTWMWCAKKMLDVFDTKSDVSVIGISKVYEEFTGGRYGLLEWLSVARGKVGINFDVHLLGYDKLTSVEVLQRDFPWVRSIDSAKPTVLAIHGIKYSTAAEVRLHGSQHKRSGDYFKTELTEKQIEDARENIALVTEVAAGTLSLLS
jgi:hypothetical protein